MPNCSAEQLTTIRWQLPATDCVQNKRRPYTQGCSFTYASACPDAVWLEDFYTQLHGRRGEGGRPPFLGIFVGCNKGMDAIDALRMGSGNAFFDKPRWREAMARGGKDTLGPGVCYQAVTPQFQLPHNASDLPLPPSSQLHPEVHCIEPMPATYQALSRAASELHYDEHGFVVAHAAMAKSDGVVAFPGTFGVGKENMGIGNCNGIADGKKCVNVTMYSLDTYVARFVPKDLPIHYLSVDVEGYDMDVILGGLNGTLQRVHYLEFEYNWMGSWGRQKLSKLVQLLDEDFGFTCYWPGFNSTIWRITGCWLEHYDIHFWGNVACVNRHVEEAQMIASSMERLFRETLLRGEGLVMTRDNCRQPILKSIYK